MSRKMMIAERCEALVSRDDDGRLQRIDFWFGAAGPPWPHHESVMAHELIDADSDAVDEIRKVTREVVE